MLKESTSLHQEKIKENAKFSDSFFRRHGSAGDFFDETVKQTLDSYESSPERFTPEEELLILHKLYLATLFDKPVAADQDGIWKVADQFSRITTMSAKRRLSQADGGGSCQTDVLGEEEFPFRSALGREYAIFLNNSANISYRNHEMLGGDHIFMPSVVYDADDIILSSGVNTLSTAGEYAQDNLAESALRSVLTGDQFRSFLSHTLKYTRDQFSDSFPQDKFLRLMISKKPAEFNRAVDVIKRVDSEERVAFTEAFLAAEFGDDFGDALLDIAENIDSEKSKEVFEAILSLRRRSAEFANMFTGIDPALAESTEKALNERITDSLIALRQVAIEGKVHEDVAPHRNKESYVSDGSFEVKVDSIGEAMEIMKGLEQTFSLGHKIINADGLQVGLVNEDISQFSMYRLVSDEHGNMLVYLRPEGGYSYDKDMEYGNSKGVEASISFVVNPLNPYDLLMPKDPDGVSIRFDREGRLVDEAPDSSDRDPTRQEGLISIDVSSGLGDPSTLPVRIGRFIAAGNRMRARRQGTVDSLHHNTNYLDQEKYGTREGFTSLVHSVIDRFEMLRLTTRHRHMARYAVNESLGLVA